MIEELDLTDKKILYHLDKNAREPISVLAKRLKIGRNVALYRVNRLKEKGIIRGSFAEINNNSLGYLNFRIFLALSNCKDIEEKELVNFLKEEKSLFWLSKVIGKWDLDIVISVKEISEFENFRTKLMEKFNPIIESIHISLLTKLYYYPKDYLISETRKETTPNILEVGKKEEIDEKDHSLLVLLTKDATTNIVDLAHKLKLSINTVKKKIKDLEKRKIISGYRLFLDHNLLGYEYYKLHLNLKYYKSSDIENLRSFLSRISNMIYTDHYINGEDFEIELHFKNEQEYLKFVEDLNKNFGHIIQNKHLIKFSEVLISRYIPLS